MTIDPQATTFTVTARSTHGHTLGGTFPTLASASQAFTDWKDASVGRAQGLGASELARVTLTSSDGAAYFLAPNGRVFTDLTLATVAYDPYIKEA